MSLPNLKKFEVWFITGSQHLYGDKVLRQVDGHSKKMAAVLNRSPQIPVQVRFRPVVKDPDEIYMLCADANASKNCIGIIAWMHTFSPAKMWISGLKILHKPILHLHTQFNRDIPWEMIDMNFMNLNQSAHGDREFGFILARMRKPAKVVVGHWEDGAVHEKINQWCRAAAGWHDWQGSAFVRFGDNMRQVAVTEGDKVEAQIKFGYSVNTHGIGDLALMIDRVRPREIDALTEAYTREYKMQAQLKKGKPFHESLRAAAAIEIGIRRFLRQGGYNGFTDTFEDLHGLKQLPGIAAQRLMAEGFGFAAEGDWKTAALVRAMKVMSSGLPGGNSFMEDYTYHLEPGNNMVLGSHMLEICPSIAQAKPSCEIHPLSIGGKDDPVRLVFNVKGGPALNASVIDMGNRFRLLVNEVEAVRTPFDLPRLPVARVLWKPLPDMDTGCSAWIMAGGAHHTVFSQNVPVESLRDFARIAGIEFVLIGKETRFDQLEKELKWNELSYSV